MLDLKRNLVYYNDDSRLEVKYINYLHQKIFENQSLDIVKTYYEVRGFKRYE